MKKLIPFAVLLLAAEVAFAQNTRKISGKVSDVTGFPVIGATIYAPDLKNGVITSDSGTFRISNLPAKMVKLRFSFVGYESKLDSFDLSNGDVQDLKIALRDEGIALDGVIVTGVANQLTKLTSSVSVSTMRSTDIEKAAPRTTAEIFRSIPGIRSEATGGDGNTNITVRGVPLSTGGSKYLQLQEDGLPVFQFGDIAFATSDIFLRADQNVSRIEAIRGGSASSMATNSPAGIINFISKTGTTEGGSITNSFGLDYQNYRTDFDYGAPMGNGMTFHVGGFYRVGEGPRTAGYNANNGGQFKANFTKEFKGGYARVYLKVLNDRAAAYMPAPVQVTGSNANPTYKSLAGFNVQRGTLLSSELLQTVNLSGDGSLATTNIADGMHPLSKSIGTEFSFDLGNGWQLEDRAKAAFNSGSFIAPFPAAVGSTSAILSQIGTAVNANLTGATLTYATTGQTYTGENAMVVHLFNTKLNNFNNYMNDLQLKKEFGKNNLLLGVYKSNQNINMDWLFSSHLMTVDGKKARLLNITDASGVSHSSNGIFAYGSPMWGNINRNYNLNYDIIAPYAAFNSSLTEALNFDASVRYDMGRVRGTYAGNTQTSADMNNDGTISAYEQSVSAIDYAHTKPVNYNYGYVSYSAGLNYMLDENSAVFARYSSGGSARADRLVFTPNLFGDGSADGKYDRLNQGELGYKLKHDIGSVFLTAFYAQTKEAVQYEVFNTTTRVIKNSYQSMGLELEGVIYPAKNLSIKGNATYTHARITEGTYKDKTPRRQAPLIYALTPTYEAGKLSVGFSLIGTTKSYTQNDNLLVMPGYAYVNPFVAYQFSSKIRASLNGNNIFNTMGFTEAEEASITENTTNIVRARSITGRTVSASVSFSF
ncbi:Outer membrane receptor proteins, mostly Fe transport [Flexibacter flexilis DSM 6793]|uniref:Outer membrane receptor proteins, mostly Fe transport n=1 Tax=Flexibacter flexilis DSM 6793 TaxID=927664 RepID=A0A1I1KS23_9BACT|nr:TonB-dependent receptor [Flexibacter flexilis]SFC60963.1 Outer membrane receptor proteins, mostly Fe transport [Flexibacter flexilis DSM 6793]